MIISSVLLSMLVYVFIGAFAGVMAGILGIGGGVVVVPGLLFVFQYNQLIPNDVSMQVAAGTSLAVMIFTTMAALNAHVKQGDILWFVFKKLLPGMVLGTIVGVLTANSVPVHWLKIIFAVFLFFVAVKMLMDLHVTHSAGFPRHWVNRLMSFFIGLVSGMLGIGGGILTVPYLTYCGVPMRKIAAVSNLCTLMLAFLGTFMFILTGINKMEAVPYSTGYVYWPAVLAVAIPSALFAPLGTKLNYILPVKQLKYVFLAILVLTAIRMLF